MSGEYNLINFTVFKIFNAKESVEKKKEFTLLACKLKLSLNICVTLTWLGMLEANRSNQLGNLI